MTSASFDAGRRLIEFVDRCDDVLFLISGGGSACVEVPIDGIDERELIEYNATLVASGLADPQGMAAALKMGARLSRSRRDRKG